MVQLREALQLSKSIGFDSYLGRVNGPAGQLRLLDQAAGFAVKILKYDIRLSLISGKMPLAQYFNSWSILMNGMSRQY
ncbi:MAG: hypothetical protein FWC64_05755 [Treponema sp.]|nr:hypothetical protein [Treponema sp.]